MSNHNYLPYLWLIYQVHHIRINDNNELWRSYLANHSRMHIKTVRMTITQGNTVIQHGVRESPWNWNWRNMSHHSNYAFSCLALSKTFPSASFSPFAQWIRALEKMIVCVSLCFSLRMLLALTIRTTRQGYPADTKKWTGGRSWCPRNGEGTFD